jgi:sigma-54 specific flagellar transcriptional regulator A
MYTTLRRGWPTGNRKAAADPLGLQRTTLVEKLKRRQRDAAPTA